MPQDSASPLTLRLSPSILEIDAADWDACANLAVPDAADGETFNPFTTHAFLGALEASGSATPDTGWAGAHLVAEDAAGAVVGVTPAYVKGHSRGEYVFDWGWAEAYGRAGGRYYPKLQVAVPFTPVTGRRLLARRAGVAEAMASGLLTIMARLDASSVHATFLAEGEQELLEARGFLPRIDQQYHWLNEGYGAFEDFLSALASRKRKAIRKERREALGPGILIERLTGKDITEAHWDAFFGFYLDTGARKWGTPYLTRVFFSLIGAAMADRILLVMAKRDGRYVAGALNFIGDRALYGRNWGAIEDHPFLHFELCYYQAIDFAIERGLARVEAGAQGEHKLARGYRPVITRSAHAIADPALRRAVADFLAHERRAVAEDGAMLAGHLPFRHEEGA